MVTKLQNDQQLAATGASSPSKDLSSIKVRVAIEPFKTRAGSSFAPLISKLASRSFLHHLLPLILVRGKFGKNNKDLTNYIFETKK